MRILVVSPIIPHKNNVRIDYVNSVIDFLKTKIDVELFWLVFQPNKIGSDKLNGSIILDVHQFQDANKLIDMIKPDVFLANPAMDPINYSISLISSLNKIPIICFDHTYFSFLQSTQIQSKKISLLFSSKLPTDDESEKKLFGRGRFYFFKYYFLLKTRLSLGINFDQITNIIKDTYDFLTGRMSQVNKFGDKFLLPGIFAFKKYDVTNINKNLFHVVGNPYWDNLSKKIRQKNNKKTINNKKILVVTSPLYEHGYWNTHQREEFLTNLFSILSKNNFSFALKIHPSSENKFFYESLFKKLNIEVDIFQDESLWDIACDYNTLISFGYSQAITEIVYSGHKLIFLNAGIVIPEPPLLKESIKEGNTIECDFNNLSTTIKDIFNISIHLSQNFENECNKIFPKTDGKSAEKIAKILLDLE
jgi:hypothetical protein